MDHQTLGSCVSWKGQIRASEPRQKGLAGIDRTKALDDPSCPPYPPPALPSLIILLPFTSYREECLMGSPSIHQLVNHISLEGSPESLGNSSRKR